MSHMEMEAREAPESVQRFLDRNAVTLANLGRQLRSRQCPFVLTSARGSSDHAASYFKYLVEIAMGIPVASVGASVVSVYGAELKARNALCVTISQSGKSPDIVSLQEAARKAGALTVAMINAEDSPVAQSADIALPLMAGPELSVAATKSFITSLAASAAVVAEWRNDDAMREAIKRLPDCLRKATAVRWPDVEKLCLQAESLYVLGRGPAFPIAAETALKLKETCAIHAEAYSLAEVMHGPLELLDEGFPVLAYVPDDAARETSQQAIASMRRTGAKLVEVGSTGLAIAPAGHPLLEPISIIQTAYLTIERVAAELGRNPDKPAHLKKVTETT